MVYGLKYSWNTVLLVQSTDALIVFPLTYVANTVYWCADCVYADLHWLVLFEILGEQVAEGPVENNIQLRMHYKNGQSFYTDISWQM